VQVEMEQHLHLLQTAQKVQIQFLQDHQLLHQPEAGLVQELLMVVQVVLVVVVVYLAVVDQTALAQEIHLL
tara:strand:+ start:102 stop:314 length:213 start_codon:yes stop_codon:yes gene_type:complete